MMFTIGVVAWAWLFSSSRTGIRKQTKAYSELPTAEVQQTTAAAAASVVAGLHVRLKFQLLDPQT